MDTPRGTSEWLLYTVLGAIADVLSAILTSVMPDKRPQRSIAASDVDKLTDEEILVLSENAPDLHPDAAVFRLTPGTVAKASQDMGGDIQDASEANTLNLLFTETTIPVPRVRRVVKREWDFLIVIDYIPGSTLAQVWPTFSIWKKIRIAFTLRRYVRQLRRLRGSATTPPVMVLAPRLSANLYQALIGTDTPSTQRICGSPIFTQVRFRRGPFASYSELSAWFNKRHQMAMDIEKLPQDDPSRNDLFDDSRPLVMTHQDLNLRNIMIDEDSRIWIIDWGWAGYYPEWFEYVAMEAQNEDDEISGTNDELWKAMIPFICGPYFKQERAWEAGMGFVLCLSELKENRIFSIDYVLCFVKSSLRLIRPIETAAK
ncbi:hypothetical protein NP233_g8702 [Leucocoprinus birnbaumii]|uniref:Aminoglycoside phosphotransferase domain-containing protein n=1 Tax=Leucocoprinus birnbaumii TaxID=56174 RepID=A0AAD5VP93_9AGAR|nr:hypothetical protein NP233_g8702 [Leucocoprinus birnbaumii]